MKKYVVTGRLLWLARQFLNENPHAKGCASNDFWGDVDCCTCNNSVIRKEYIKECEKIVEAESR